MSLKKVKAGRGHYYQIDGETWSGEGVTTLIGDGMPKPGLINWAADTTASYAVDHFDELVPMKPSERLKQLKGARFADRDEAGRRGTEVHGLAERLMLGEEIDVPDEIAGHVESCVKFLDQWGPKPVITETVVANRKWHYAGSLDFVADFPKLGRRIVDYKTARSGIYGETALQLSAYVHAEVYLDAEGEERQLADLEIDTETGFGVWIRADGFDLIPLEIGADTFKTFLHVATVARRARDLRSLVGQAVVA